MATTIATLTQKTDGSLDCATNPMWMQDLASSFGLVFPECNPNAVETTSRIVAAPNAKVADLATRIRVHINIRQQQESYTRDKGINNGTLDIVCNCCRQFTRPFLAEEVVEGSGLAYQTVVRYLQYLQDQKWLLSSSHYGKVGRPKKKYQLVDTEAESCCKN